MRRAATVALPTRYGDFKAIGYESVLDGSHHVAVVKGDVAGKKDVLVRVHSECLTGDVFGSLRCDCGDQLAEAHAPHRGGGRRASCSTCARRVAASG